VSGKNRRPRQRGGKRRQRSIDAHGRREFFYEGLYPGEEVRVRIGRRLIRYLADGADAGVGWAATALARAEQIKAEGRSSATARYADELVFLPPRPDGKSAPVIEGEESGVLVVCEDLTGTSETIALPTTALELEPLRFPGPIGDATSWVSFDVLRDRCQWQGVPLPGRQVPLAHKPLMPVDEEVLHAAEAIASTGLTSMNLALISDDYQIKATVTAAVERAMDRVASRRIQVTVVTDDELLERAPADTSGLVTVRRGDHETGMYAAAALDQAVAQALRDAAQGRFPLPAGPNTFYLSGGDWRGVRQEALSADPELQNWSPAEIARARLLSEEQGVPIEFIRTDGGIGHHAAVSAIVHDTAREIVCLERWSLLDAAGHPWAETGESGIWRITATLESRKVICLLGHRQISAGRYSTHGSIRREGEAAIGLLEELAADLWETFIREPGLTTIPPQRGCVRTGMGIYSDGDLRWLWMEIRGDDDEPPVLATIATLQDDPRAENAWFITGIDDVEDAHYYWNKTLDDPTRRDAVRKQIVLAGCPLEIILSEPFIAYEMQMTWLAGPISPGLSQSARASMLADMTLDDAAAARKDAERKVAKLEANGDDYEAFVRSSRVDLRNLPITQMIEQLRTNAREDDDGET